MSFKSGFAAMVLLAGSTMAAQAFPEGTPPFYGQLLIKPSLDTTMCLTAENKDGARALLRPCTGAATQKWTFTANSRTVSAHGNKCLDVAEGVDANMTPLQVWSCDPKTPNVNQRWWYDHWGKSLKWEGKTRCMDVPNGNSANGTQIHIWDCKGDINQSWDVGYIAGQAPDKTQPGQYGTSKCGTGSITGSNCQTVWLNSAQDFCLFAPPYMSTVGDTEHSAIAYCTGGRGARPIPDGTLKGVHFVKTSKYVQVTGAGNFTNINIQAGDYGGEIDNRGADGTGNPAGGLLYSDAFGTGRQSHEWTEFISDGEFCLRACFDRDATKLCNHVYDIMGCWWNMPANYNPGQFENCAGENALPMGVYGTSTWKQGTAPTPSAHPVPASSNCTPLPTVTLANPSLGKRGGHKQLARRLAANAEFPGATAAP